MRDSWRKFGCAVVLLLLGSCGLTCVWSMGLGQSYTTWEHFGSVQVLAGPDELWLFMEVERMIYLPGGLVSASTRSVGRRQIVAVLTETDEPRRVVVQPDNGTSFHVNQGRVFRHGDKTYLFKGASMNTRRSAFAWNAPRFELLPPPEADALIRSNGLSELSPSEINPALDQLSERDGWAALFSESRFCSWSDSAGDLVALPDNAFEWRGRRFTWEEEASPTGLEVSLSVEAEGATSQISLLNYDPHPVPLSTREVKALYRRPRQSARPW